MSDFFMPKHNLLGQGSIEKVEGFIRSRQYSRALIVTDPFIYTGDVFKRVIRMLTAAGCAFAFYKDVQPNPSTEAVEQVMTLIRDEPCDCILSIGGGSAHDLAKAVAVTATNGGKITDYEGVDLICREVLPIIAVNTTAGTGSEVTAFAVITDSIKRIKMVIADRKMIPWISVNDPSTMVTMPPKLTVETGMDALTHAIEAYVSKAGSPITDACALKAITLIHENIQIVHAQGQDIEARERMAEAAFLAGMAFSNASLGYVHAIAHQLGGLYNLPHGLCNAVLLPYIVEFNGTRSSGSKYGDIADALGLQIFNRSDPFSHKRVVQYLHRLNEILKIPRNLKTLGVLEKDFETIAQNALKDACSATNPIQTDMKGIQQILKHAY